MNWLLTEFVLKGIFLGLLTYAALLVAALVAFEAPLLWLKQRSEL